MKFEWDSKKEKISIQKHGITFEQASYVFADPYALNKYDDEHSQDEDRWLLLGKSMDELILISSAYIQRSRWHRTGKNYQCSQSN